MVLGRVRVFIAHASEQAALAQTIAVKLRARGLNVFLDSETLRVGQDFDARIEQFVGRCDLFLFLVSPSSVQRGRYTLTELGYAKRRWPAPQGRVLPVMAVETPLADVDSYLTQNLHVLKASGDLPTEVANAVIEAARALRSRALRRVFVTIAAIAAIAGAVAVATRPDRTSPDTIVPVPSAAGSVSDSGAHDAVAPSPSVPPAVPTTSASTITRTSTPVLPVVTCHLDKDSDGPWDRHCEPGHDKSHELTGGQLESYRRTFPKCTRVFVHWCD